MRRIIVGMVLMGALASGCGGDSDDKVEIGVPAQSVATTSTTFKDSLVCIQGAESSLPWGDEAMREPPCPSPSTATVPEEQVVCVEQSSTSGDVHAIGEDPMVCTDHRDAQIKLRDALTAEKTYYTDTLEYTADVEVLAAIEPSLDWGGAVKVAAGGEFNDAVCLSATSAAGTEFALGDVASGPHAGYYFGETCPTEISAETVSAMGASW